ncbi:hypothetical protein Tco_0220704, partial [Tanacetum coccineum]
LFVIELNEFVSINSLTELRDAIFDEHRFSSIPRPSNRTLNTNGTDDIGNSKVPDKVFVELMVQQLKLRKHKMNRTSKSFGPEFQLYLVEGIMNEVSNQHSYYFIVEDDPKTFDESMKSQDIAF